LILAGTLFPFDFSFDEQISISDEFSPGGAMRPRGNDLIIGADAAFSEAFRGKIGELRICADALTPDQVAKEAQLALAAQAGARSTKGCAASYSFAESSGTVLRDDSGNENHGKLIGGPQWLRDGGRGALFFNGSGQYVRVPNNPSIDFGGHSITLSMRVALEDSPSDGVIVAKPWRQGVWEPPYYQYGVEFGKFGRSVDFYFADTRGRLMGPFSVKPPVGPWTHIAFVYDGAVRGYVDGREVLAANVGHPWELSDIVGNLLLFVPFAFGLAAVGQSRGIPPGRAIPLIIALGAALALGVETLQCWLPDRDPSWIDVAANGASSALGAGLYFAASAGVLERLKRLLFRL
jgi:VanZ like family/Concanavalin A-like lectin/glucanases superfamily